MGETTRTDEEIELAELRELSAFFNAQKEIAPTGGRALLEFLAAMRSELLGLRGSDHNGGVKVVGLCEKGAFGR